MIQLDQMKLELQQYEAPMEEVRDSLDLDYKKQRIEELQRESEAPDLYEQEQYHLAEKGPFRSAASDKTGDTRGRGGRKQRGEQAWRASIRGGTG